ncbi:MAG: helix-turn-helix transcriptional regulator [Clostridia bacterium]|nr:helix-turn-helix transcriptional regulator [Clostridia bacterium]
MDQIKIGHFIAQKRKEIGLTQMQLAEKLDITDRAVSKWETGRSLPDSSIMLDLCSILKINVNDLLNGEVIMENYNEKTEQLLLEMTKQKEDSDKRLLFFEIIIGIFSVIILLGGISVAAFLSMAVWLRVCIIILSFIVAMIGFVFALRIEQTAGYYECGNCHHRYVPTFSQVVMAMHINRTRYMKCPKCGKKSWQKKVISLHND